MSKSKSVTKKGKMKKVPAHVLADVELGEGRWFRLVPSLAGGNLDSRKNMKINVFETQEYVALVSKFLHNYSPASPPPAWQSPQLAPSCPWPSCMQDSEAEYVEPL